MTRGGVSRGPGMTRGGVYIIHRKEPQAPMENNPKREPSKGSGRHMHTGKSLRSSQPSSPFIHDRPDSKPTKLWCESLNCECIFNTRFIYNTKCIYNTRFINSLGMTRGGVNWSPGMTRGGVS